MHGAMFLCTLTELPSKYNFVTLVCLQNRAKCWAFVRDSRGLAWFALKGVAESCLGGSGLWLVLQSNLPSNCASAVKASSWSNPRSLIWCVHTGGACILVMVVDPIQLRMLYLQLRSRKLTNAVSRRWMRKTTCCTDFQESIYKIQIGCRMEPLVLKQYFVCDKVTLQRGWSSCQQDSSAMERHGDMVSLESKEGWKAHWRFRNVGNLSRFSRV